MKEIEVVQEKDGVRFVPSTIEARSLCRRLLAAFSPPKGEEREVFDLDIRNGRLLVASSGSQHEIAVNPQVAERLSFLLSGFLSLGVESSRNEDGSFRLYPF